jgi:hypothetical protein
MAMLLLFLTRAAVAQPAIELSVGAGVLNLRTGAGYFEDGHGVVPIFAVTVMPTATQRLGLAFELDWPRTITTPTNPKSWPTTVLIHQQQRVAAILGRWAVASNARLSLNGLGGLSWIGVRNSVQPDLQPAIYSAWETQPGLSAGAELVVKVRRVVLTAPRFRVHFVRGATFREQKSPGRSSTTVGASFGYRF